MTPHSILAVTDFSTLGDHSLARAGMLCAEHGATLELIYLAPPGEPPPPDAACRLAHHALQLGQHHDIQVRTLNKVAFEVADVVAETHRADLLIWGTEPMRGVRSFLMGQPVEGIVRKCQRPVLVVRRPADGPYQSLVVAVDFSKTSRGLVDLVLALNTTAQVELFHAVTAAHEGKLRYAQVSEQAIKAYREQCRRYARDRMLTLADSYDARRNRLLSSLGYGDPARQVLVQQQHTGADLIVVGKQPSSMLSDLLFESVAQRVLRDAHTDVLVVPHDFQPASSASARRRLAGGPAIRRVRAGAPQPPGLPNQAAMLARAVRGTGSIRKTQAFSRVPTASRC
ncbi:universal stress protein [Variovorax sp. J22P240]|uniref:universal stress protein n=1 Tax=Variovorax sp. J22P240 TaxID=3053514 RepID=UPI0025781815|nr:universal stress protein [Variovorax sp. J22P240]MDM0002656.1 universal stress protein [Variovorax sp. J22P240]